ncbi:UNVERIFIED_CONTAM: hypothetical protein Cloal_0020 [Acetivibrio alkalicellulosi]
MIVKNISKNTILASNCKVANTFFKRFLGLMFKKYLPLGQGLLITPCNSIHMFFMKFPLDIVFIDKGQTVVYTIENITPWKCSKIIKTSYSVLELPVGTIKNTQTTVGDKIGFSSELV